MNQLARTAVVTGAAGQDGQLLAALLRRKNYRVIAVTRPGGAEQIARFGQAGVETLAIDIRDRDGLAVLIDREQPDELYNLAALSSAGGQWETVHETLAINGSAVVSLLELLRQHSPGTRFCQASSCEMFGFNSVTPQTEVTALIPDTPYAIAKAQAHHAVRAYRKRWGLFACSAVLFSHASELRSASFLIGKVTREAAEVAKGLRSKVSLHSLTARRDWGYAQDYMRAMHVMLTADSPDDYIVATGEEHSVEEVCQVAFSTLGLDYREYVSTANGDVTERAPYLGNTQHIESTLGWEPSLSFGDMIERLTRFHLSQLPES